MNFQDRLENFFKTYKKKDSRGKSYRFFILQILNFNPGIEREKLYSLCKKEFKKYRKNKCFSRRAFNISLLRNFLYGLTTQVDDCYYLTNFANVYQ